MLPANVASLTNAASFSALMAGSAIVAPVPNTDPFGECSHRCYVCECMYASYSLIDTQQAWQVGQ